jgi:endonuclease V-like protein UPF0215 family
VSFSFEGILSPQRIRQVKREIRVLGVAARRRADGFLVVGAVYRGSLWLDGVLWGHAGDLAEAIVEMLLGSLHEGQVRVILLSRENLPADAKVAVEELSAKAGRPVIILGEGELTFKAGSERIPYSVAGLSRWSAESGIRAATREGAIPEVLRVAALTLSGLPEAEDA